MEEVFARRDLIEPARLRALSGKSDVAGFLQVGSHLGAIALTGTGLWLTWGSWWAVPFFIAHGVLLNFLYAGQHELSHWTVFKTRALNEWFGRLFGFIVLYPRDFDQIQHFAHHRYTQDWNRDGELARPPYTFASYALYVLGPTYWYYRVRRIVRYSLGIVTEPYIPEGRKAEVIREARWHATGYVAIAVLSVVFQSWAAVLLWLAPMMATKVVHQLQNTIEHLGLAHEPNILENTRSTRTNAFMRWMAWNMQYHTAHHAFPGVPFHQLPELHKALFTEKGREPHTMSYLAFQWEVLKAFASGRTEADFPDEEMWISSREEKARRASAKAA